ncbi:MAG: diguanylate cyclase [Gammaproteobacteria bacterium]|nr:diguanylate cyclase [Sideroxydans sp.]MBU3903338.1 diguanylate cyclase [Gammaproteobacteria bacterium]MBU4046529.1 diguanylate cyclase [Gammaproteobacteria bacterium]
MTMIRNWWYGLSMRLKLSLLIQVGLLIILVFTQRWLMASFETKILQSAQVRAEETADGIINGMNMLMLTSQISDPANRMLFIDKMSQSRGIRELRIIRSELVDRQFGPGLPEERVRDEIDRRVLQTGKPYFERRDAEKQSLRAVFPFIASHNYKGTDCLACHHVPDGTVNGAASIVLDLTEEFELIRSIDAWLWIGQLLLQLVLFFMIDVLIRSFTNPLKKLQNVMSAIQEDGDLSRRVDIKSRDEIGKMANAFNALTDSLQKSVEQVKQGQEQLRLAAEVFVSSAEAIVITDVNNNIMQVNRAFTQITGYAAEEVIGKNPRILKSGEQGPEFYKEMWDTLLSTGSWQGEVMDRRKSGEVYPKWLSIAVVKNEQGEITNYIALFTDITERRASFERIQQLAHFDALTNLPNRTLLNQHIEQSLLTAKRNRNKMALLFLDLDGFKGVNDTLGHHAGDMLLREVSIRLKRCVRETDMVSRLGGDEFVVVMSAINKSEDAAQVAQKIIASICEPFEIEGHTVNIGTSIGISIYPDDADESDSLKKFADAAMYEVKQAGKNHYRFHGQPI